MAEEEQEVRDGEGDDDRFTVLEVFGLKLEVSNPRLADLLTMDATEALATDIAAAKTPEGVREVVADAREGVPDVVLTPQTPHDEHDTVLRKEMRERVSGLGDAMGFTTHVDGTWESPTGVVILSRVVEKPLSFAGAAHFVEEMAERRKAVAGEESTVLFVAPDQQTADVFKVAIRQARLYHLMRTVSLDNLADVAGMLATGAVDHNQAIILLAPVADIDVGEILSVIRSASGSNGG